MMSKEDKMSKELKMIGWLEKVLRNFHGSAALYTEAELERFRIKLEKLKKNSHKGGFPLDIG